MKVVDGRPVLTFIEKIKVWFGRFQAHPIFQEAAYLPRVEKTKLSSFEWDGGDSGNYNLMTRRLLSALNDKKRYI